MTGNTQGTLPETTIIIIGAGLAGLYAGHLLQLADITYRILEVDDHAGGRVFSRPARGARLTLDEGANLINSTDRIAIRLMNDFGIRYVRRVRPGSDSMHYLARGQELDEDAFNSMMFAESAAALSIIAADQGAWAADEGRATNPRFIDESIASYLTRISAGPVFTSFMESFFWSEYGHPIRDLNLHVFFEYVVIDPHARTIKLIPHVDEAYTVPEGAGQIAMKLAAAQADNIHYGRRVTSIIDNNHSLLISATLADGSTEQHEARHVFFAAPLHSLARIQVDVEGLSQYALQEAATATYARGTKLHLKFKSGFHRLYRFSGILLTDTGEQIWTSGTGQEAGLLTVLTGPLPEGETETAAAAESVLQLLEAVCPGVRSLFTGVERSDAPASYSGSFRPGEDAHFLVHAGGARWTTIGEASHPELQGYLEGALRSAEEGVERYLVKRHQKKRKH
jgi:monoamine oxidase